MDSGTAAVLGGVITGFSTGAVALAGTYAALRQSREQLRGTARLALREPRRRIYSDFLTESREVRAALAGLVDEETGEADTGQVESLLAQRLPRLRHLQADVDLEGPASVSDAAGVVVDTFRKLYLSAVGANLSGDVDDDGRPLSFAGDFLGEVRGASTAFVPVARTALATDAD